MQQFAIVDKIFQMKTQSRFFSTLFLAGLAVTTSTTFLTSCMPRGESKSIEEVYNRAHEEFIVTVQSAKGNSVKGDNINNIKKALFEIDSSLQKFVAMSSSSSNGKSLSTNSFETVTTPLVDNLNSLILSAGYTSRPAFGELIQQLEYLAQINSAGLTKEQAEITNSTSRKLLAARVYDLLSSEIKGVGFQLKEREMRS